ncbi:hypothetical protein PV396_18585 [Streptomyces sp. ME02-8801-2C]|uniref:hypothetical protein n=1 Tax=Streptomyces sp. ME02-8801-2C TaxID=3028680 RepID=UPI0029A3DBAB|nr:hypothetical protein [Streptomyces sp. ME02-8801-2C]MDX3453929.1 hypothetical protein [Streptomyces sp. ME02-8801-2C]
MNWEVKRTPGHPLRRADDDRLALPLTLTGDGKPATDAELVLSLAEAEHLHAALCRALDGTPAPGNSPDCRRPVQASTKHGPIAGRA